MNSHKQGIRKAAILVTCLDTATADKLLDQMSSEQAAEVRRAVMDLGEIDAAEQQRVVEEFIRVGPMVPAKQPSGIELDIRLANKLSAPEYVAARAAQSASPGEDRPFGFLQDAESEKLAKVLTGERPQTIALVLSHLSPEQAGEILTRLQPVVQVDVIRRLVELEETDPGILQEVETALAARFSQQVPIQRRRVAGIQAVSGIIKACDGRLGMQIFDTLKAYDRRLADKIDLPSISFDDLPQLDDAALATLFREVGMETTQIALFGADPLLVERMLRKLPARDAARARREIDFPGPIRLSDVEDARRQVAETARRLAFQGRIRAPHRFSLDAAA